MSSLWARNNYLLNWKKMILCQPNLNVGSIKTFWMSIHTNLAFIFKLCTLPRLKFRYFGVKALALTLLFVRPTINWYIFLSDYQVFGVFPQRVYLVLNPPPSYFFKIKLIPAGLPGTCHKVIIKNSDTLEFIPKLNGAVG